MQLRLEDDLWWTARIRLVSWIGYQSRLGPYGAVDSSLPSDGTVSLVFAPEDRGIEPLDSRELQLLAWFEEHEKVVSEQVKKTIICWCSPDYPERLRKFDLDEALPIIRNENDLQKYIGILSINIHQIDREGIPYIGYEFGCDWEEEHGLGVLMHGARAVEVGFADTAILLWIAEKDAQRLST